MSNDSLCFRFFYILYREKNASSSTFGCVYRCVYVYIGFEYAIAMALFHHQNAILSFSAAFILANIMWEFLAYIVCRYCLFIYVWVKKWTYPHSPIIISQTYNCLFIIKFEQIERKESAPCSVEMVLLFVWPVAIGCVAGNSPKNEGVSSCAET